MGLSVLAGVVVAFLVLIVLIFGNVPESGNGYTAFGIGLAAFYLLCIGVPAGLVAGCVSALVWWIAKGRLTPRSSRG